MEETNVATQESPPKSGKPSEGEKGSISELETFTKEQVRNLISNALAEQGQKHKTEIDKFAPIVKERDDMKSQLSTMTESIKDLEDTKVKLIKDIDELSKDDPDKAKLSARLRELDSEIKARKTEKQEIEKEKQANAETVKLAQDTLREISIWEISAEYDGGNPVTLKEIIADFEKHLSVKISNDEQIHKIAETLWAKKIEPATPVIPPITPDSGGTSGGSESTAETRLKQRFPTMYKK